MGTLAAGASTTLTYYVVFASDRVSAENLYQAQLRTQVPVAPTTATFVNGVWTGSVTVSQAATNMYLEVNDGSGHIGDSSTFNVSNLPPVTVTVPTDAREGMGVVAGAIRIPNALTSDLTVSLASSDPSRLSVPATVVIPAGQVSAPVPVTIIDDGLLNGPEAVSITASATGYAAGTATTTVHDNETATLSVTLPATAHETAGTIIGTVTSSAAPTQNITVQLTSSDTTRLTVPATVTLLAGQTSVNFTATLLDDHVIEPGADPGHGDLARGELDRRRGDRQHCGRRPDDDGDAARLGLGGANPLGHGADGRHVDDPADGVAQFQRHHAS